MRSTLNSTYLNRALPKRRQCSRISAMKLRISAPGGGSALVR